jgi:nitrogen regulation protein NR(I)
MNPVYRVLLIEDDTSAANALRRVLAAEGHQVSCEARGDSGLARAQSDEMDVVITDLRLPGLNGLELVRQLHSAKPRLPIILMTAHGTTETAIEATKLGAYDYLVKPFEMEELLDLVEKAVATSRLMTQPVEMGDVVSVGNALIGNSRLMQNIYKEIGRVAAKPVPVLIRGETGTGKELIARAIYQHSDRSKAPFVAVNCAAIPETLLESELFGHERGAFTGADVRRIGRFEQASSGTLFLDEIGDMSIGTQAKLLRVLQEKYIHRLGGKEPITIDTRVIAATHRDLETALREKQFRDDLYYRLNVVVIKVPSLQQRAEDIPNLVTHFMQRYGGEFGIEAPSIQPEAIQFLQQQPWPGNVRELENVVRQALLLAGKYTISLDHVRQVVAKMRESASASNQSIVAGIGEYLDRARRGEMEGVHARVIEEVERELFAQAIHMAQGNQARAARWLGVSRITMREKLQLFGLHPTQRGDGAGESDD